MPLDIRSTKASKKKDAHSLDKSPAPRADLPNPTEYFKMSALANKKEADRLMLEINLNLALGDVVPDLTIESVYSEPLEGSLITMSDHSEAIYKKALYRDSSKELRSSEVRVL